MNYGIQNGAHLSRARVLYFKHNDAADLERVLRQVAAEDRRSRWAGAGGGQRRGWRQALCLRALGHSPVLWVLAVVAAKDRSSKWVLAGAAAGRPVLGR